MALDDFQPDTGVFAQELHLDGDPDPMFVTIGLTKDDHSAPTIPDATAITGALVTVLEPMICDVYSIRSGTLRYRNGATVGPVDTIVEGNDPAVNGDLESPAAPQNTAVLVRKLTSDAGRGSNGRMYVPGGPAAMISSDGFWDQDHVDLCQTQFDLLDAALSACGYSPVLLHHGPEPTYTSEPFGIIEAFVVEKLAATQRRRLR